MSYQSQSETWQPKRSNVRMAATEVVWNVTKTLSEDTTVENNSSNYKNLTPRENSPSLPSTHSPVSSLCISIETFGFTSTETIKAY